MDESPRATERGSMYVIDRAIKADPVRQWRLPDRVFFAAGACQVLAYAALRRHGGHGFGAYWIRPTPGFRGNHIIIHDGANSFDYHGWSKLPDFAKSHSQEGISMVAGLGV